MTILSCPRCGNQHRRGYVPAGALADERALRVAIARVLTAPGVRNADAIRKIAALVAEDGSPCHLDSVIRRL